MTVLIGIAKGLLLFLLLFLLLLPFELFISWTSMLWLGVAHSLDSRVPALGYWTCFFLLWVFSNVVTVALLAKDMREAIDKR